MDPSLFTDELDKILCGLANATTDTESGASAVDISACLLREHRLQIHWRRIESRLRENGDLAAARRRNKRWHFTLLADGDARLQRNADAIVMVDPRNAVSEVTRLHDTLQSLTGLIRVCDPYLDHRALEHLDAINTGANIRFLTYNISDTGGLRALHAAFGSKGLKLEVRKVAGNVLHDRYIIADQRMLILGSSLNSFGKKQCFVVRAGQDLATSMTTAFDAHWKTGTIWP